MKPALVCFFVGIIFMGASCQRHTSTAEDPLRLTYGVVDGTISLRLENV
jgi:hypothetical protein